MKLVEVARSLVGTNFHPGQTEQCMAFVRHCLEQARHPLANRVTAQAVDGLETSFFLASSLAGRDLGPIVAEVSAVQAGAILFWQDTYDGWWPPGTITHVGIAIGNGRFVHRPTVSKPVMEESLSGYWARQFRCALLTEAVEADPGPRPPEPRRWKMFSHSGRMSIVSDGAEQTSGSLKIDAHSGKLQVVLGGKVIAPGSVKIEIVY